MYYTALHWTRLKYLTFQIHMVWSLFCDHEYYLRNVYCKNRWIGPVFYRTFLRDVKRLGCFQAQSPFLVGYGNTKRLKIKGNKSAN